MWKSYSGSHKCSGFKKGTPIIIIKSLVQISLPSFGPGWIFIKFFPENVQKCTFSFSSDIKQQNVEFLTCCTTGRSSLVCLPLQTWSESAPRCSCSLCLLLGEPRNLAFNHVVQIWFMLSGDDEKGRSWTEMSEAGCVLGNMERIKCCFTCSISQPGLQCRERDEPLELKRVRLSLRKCRTRVRLVIEQQENKRRNAVYLDQMNNWCDEEE